MTGGLVGLDISLQDEVVIAAVSGELDLAEAAATGDAIAQAVPAAARGVVVDLSELGFIDSSGIAMLFGLVRTFRSRRQRLSVVVRAGDSVERVLEIVEFGRAAPMRPERTAALADMN